MTPFKGEIYKSDIFKTMIKMDLNDWWVGDWVRILSSGKRGKFEGTDSNGYAKVKVDHQLFVVTAADLELTDDPGFDRDLIKKKVKKSEMDFFDFEKSLSFNRTLDLHLEKTNYNASDWPLGELDYQKFKCKEFLKEAIRLRIPRVIIVHGIGTGVLRNNVEEVLNTFMEVERSAVVNDGGATEVWLEY